MQSSSRLIPLFQGRHCFSYFWHENQSLSRHDRSGWAFCCLVTCHSSSLTENVAILWSAMRLLNCQFKSQKWHKETKNPDIWRKTTLSICSSISCCVLSSSLGNPLTQFLLHCLEFMCKTCESLCWIWLFWALCIESEWSANSSRCSTQWKHR